ncbi:spore coat protein GerQ [Peribacillus kribbensis]|uniref:spore coat protein GerQ n=1 Tax=Peribacillus kribbensis TaxID=356658 RepID=UPI000424D0ED|nr:spore coat protein GerQ [Peribacillus kribbensis]
MRQSETNPYSSYGYTPPHSPYQGQQQGYQGPGGSQGYQPQQLPGSQPIMTYKPPSAGGMGGGGMGAGGPGAGMLPTEQSYIENILRLNRGKLATVYATFENNREWNAKIFKGIVEAAGRDHIILSDPQSGTRYIILMVYVDYITFDEEIEYEYPYGAGQAGLATYPPR